MSVKKNDKKAQVRLKKKQRIYVIIAAIAAIIACVFIIVSLVLGRKHHDGPTEPINEKFSFVLNDEATIIKNDDIFSGQYDIRNKIMSEYNKGKYTINNPYVVKNPYLISPQTALILFKTSKKEKVTVTVKGKNEDDLVTTFEEAKDHFLPIYGLYGDYENTVLIKTESGEEARVKINISEKLDTGSVKVLQNDIKNSNGEFYFATSSLGVGAMAYDNYGEVRWWLDMGYSKGMTMLQNGHILLSSVNEGPDITSTSGVVEVDMLGYVHHEYEIEGGYHHDGFELENGNLIILTSRPSAETIADYIVEIDRETGKIVRSWDLLDIVTKIDDSVIGEQAITWGWINSVTYDKTSNSLILSVRNQNSVISIGYDSKQINWILGDKKYWSKKFDKYLIKGVGSDFIYPKGQHSVNITKEGYLSIFNNGYDAHNESAISCKKIANNASYAMVYDLDLTRREAKVVWKFGGKEYFSYALSSFTYAKDNHKVFNSGWHFTDEVNIEDPTCTQFSNDKYDTYVIEFDENNNEILKLHIDESKFEVVKAPIYNLGAVSVKSNEDTIVKNYQVSTGNYLTTYPDEVYEVLSESEALKYATNEKCFIAFQMYNKRFKLIGAVPDEMDLRVTFISARGVAYRYTLKEKNKDLKDFINISALPKGKYYVYVNMGKQIYNTLEFIEIK